jgi:hypothetical protein
MIVRRVVVGSVTSASGAVNKLNAFVAEASPDHDLSTKSWRAVWIANFGIDPDGSPGKVNRGGIGDLLNRLDACAPSYAGGCDKATDMVFEGVNRDLGLPADNGWISFEQMMAWLGRYPVNADDPPGGDAIYVPPPEPHPIFLVSPDIVKRKSDIFLMKAPEPSSFGLGAAAVVVFLVAAAAYGLTRFL